MPHKLTQASNVKNTKGCLVEVWLINDSTGYISKCVMNVFALKKTPTTCGFTNQHRFASRISIYRPRVKKIRGVVALTTIRFSLTLKNKLNSTFCHLVMFLYNCHGAFAVTHFQCVALATKSLVKMETLKCITLHMRLKTFSEFWVFFQLAVSYPDASKSRKIPLSDKHDF